MHDTQPASLGSPFSQQHDVERFHASPTHEEALARLLFLVESNRRFGLIFGESGTGKTMLLRVLMAELKRHHWTAAYIDLYGLDVEEMLLELAAALNLMPIHSARPSEHFRHIEDCLHAMSLTRQSCVLCLDHLDRADSGCVNAVARLIHPAPGRASHATFIVATQPDHLSRMARLVEEQSDLRIEVNRLQFEEAVWYISDTLDKAGWDPHLFDAEAISDIHSKSHGIPRDINRLCELALLAASSEEEERVTVSVVESAYAELGRYPRREAVAVGS